MGALRDRYGVPERAQLTGDHVAQVNPTSSPRKSLRERLSRGSVEWSPDLSRILSLPRRPRPDLNELAEVMTALLRAEQGGQTLRPHQAWALYEATLVGGVFGQLAVGSGKTLAGLLMPMVMPRCRRAVLFIPPSLRAQLLERDWAFYEQHWRLPNLVDGKRFEEGRPMLRVVAYSELSSQKSTMLLEHEKPDLIIADEVHLLKNFGSSKVRRFLHYMAKHPDTRFCGWSGTVTSKSLRDYAHLVAIALGDGSPLPLHRPTVDEWAAALDPTEVFFDEGRLRLLCAPGEDARDGFRRRLVDTVGVVSTDANALGTSLVFSERKAPPVPQEVKQHLRELRQNWIRPDGEELVNAASVFTCARELASGFYLRWRFPKMEPEHLIEEWFCKRQSWHRELREKLKDSRPYLDSPAYCVRAAIRWYEGGCPKCRREALRPHAVGCDAAYSHPLWSAFTWPFWRQIKDSVYHEPEVVWLSDYVVKDAAAWMTDKPGIVWVENPAIGVALSKITGFPYHGGGKQASSDILKEDGKRSIIASINAHREGKNLQGAFSRNLVIAVMPDAGGLEQVIGRTHREGQPEDEVTFEFYLHTTELKDALEKAQLRAKYVQETTGSAQKLCYGSWAEDVRRVV